MIYFPCRRRLIIAPTYCERKLETKQRNARCFVTIIQHRHFSLHSIEAVWERVRDFPFSLKCSVSVKVLNFPEMWGNIFLYYFYVDNCVCQGGNVSGAFYTLVMDELSKQFNMIFVGHLAYFKLINHVMYADDIYIMDPSAKGLNMLSSACNIC